ncbi:MAG: beta-hydroxyacyl-ACP dehydratase [Spirochaetes bacterium]|jgi:3-hydroxymyristoyl/3-hydroxydecanoyl-(acyl carrier protein) dehydratase|nr:beta-hydroxyacyl-ACP dehydratase [Spirochaetota bacterium]
MNQPAPEHLLPHGDSFRFVDTVIGYSVSEETIHCSKQFTGDESFFSSHFPGNPLLPGVIITEALAQTSGLISFFIHSDNVQRSGYLLQIEKMKFLKSISPPALLEYKAKMVAYTMGTLKTEVLAFSNNELVAKGSLILSI